MSWFSPSPYDQSLIGLLRQSPPRSLSSDAKRMARQQWLRAYQQQAWTTPTPSVMERHGWILRPAYLLASIVAAVLIISTSVTVASASAFPGQPLYLVGQAVENVRLVLAVTPAAKARVATDIAQQRQQKVAAVSRALSNSDATAEAQADANIALNTAISAIAAAQVHATSNSSVNTAATGQASTTLKKVEEKLEQIRQLREQNTPSRSSTLLKRATAKISGSQATVSVTVGKRVIRFTLRSTQRDAIIAAISQRTGVNIAEVASKLNIIPAPTPAKKTPDRNQNLPTTNQENPSGDNHPNNPGQDAEQHSGATVTVELNQSDGQAQIHVMLGEQEQSWELQTLNPTAIALSISARTGLSVADIESTWHLKSE